MRAACHLAEPAAHGGLPPRRLASSDVLANHHHPWRNNRWPGIEQDNLDKSCWRPPSQGSAESASSSGDQQAATDQLMRCPRAKGLTCSLLPLSALLGLAVHILLACALLSLLLLHFLHLLYRPVLPKEAPEAAGVEGAAGAAGWGMEAGGLRALTV